jgi:hypothetical protein
MLAAGEAVARSEVKMERDLERARAFAEALEDLSRHLLHSGTALHFSDRQILSRGAVLLDPQTPVQ